MNRDQYQQKAQIISLRHKARKYYPNNVRMQHTWVRQTAYLLRTGKHGLLTGGWVNGHKEKEAA